MSDKAIAYELQRIDCNCNDCGYLIRLLDKQNIVLSNDKTTQEDRFYGVRNRKTNRANETIASLHANRYLIKNVEAKIQGQIQYIKELESSKYGYQGQRTPIQYGRCCKFEKEITFIPNITQLETQKCFIHRKDYTHVK